MAIYHGYDGVLELATVDLSDHCVEFEIVETAAEISTTRMGHTHQARTGGLKSFTLTATLQQDQAAGETYATLQPLVGTVVTFLAKATSASTSATNRAVSGSVLLTEFSHMNIEPGTLDTFSVTWPGSGSLTVATS